MIRNEAKIAKKNAQQKVLLILKQIIGLNFLINKLIIKKNHDSIAKYN